MHPKQRLTSPVSATLLLSILCFGVSGCAKDSGKASTIVARGPPVTAPAPSATPYTFRAGDRVDSDSIGGDDDVQTHQTSSGYTISKGSISGGYERMEASSAKFKVTGGLYVQ